MNRLVALLGIFFLLVTTAYGQGVDLTFTLDTPGYVTLVITDENDVQVRNFIQETFFDAGTHTVHWDGYNEGLPTNKNRAEGDYDIERFLVEPGNYRLKALFHEGIDLVYEMSVQSPGTPPWHTPDESGAWHGDYNTAWDVALIPGGNVEHTSDPVLLFVSKSSEGSHGVILLNEDGKKVFGKMAMPGGFLAGHNVTFDRGPSRDFNIAAYIAVLDGTTLRMHQYRKNRDQSNDDPVSYTLGEVSDENMRGFAAYNKVLAASLKLEGKIVFFDEPTRSMIGEVVVNDPRGLYVTEDQELYVVEGTVVNRYDADFATATLTLDATVVSSDLEDPQAITLANDEIYVTDWGTSHQVKVFDLSGNLLRVIGSAGGPHVGLYDETRMAFPRGIAVDTQGKLWVAEQHFAPKRISKWDGATGAFEQGWYGPPKYGGGGTIDPQDPTRLVYAQAGGYDKKRVMEFELDWVLGESRLKRILLDESTFLTGDTLPERGPEFIRNLDGRSYQVNNNQRPGDGKPLVSIYMLEGDELIPVGVTGVVSSWDRMERLNEWTAFHTESRKVFFVWTDDNLNRFVDAGETQYHAKERFGGTVFVEPDMSITNIWGDKIDAPTVAANGVPVYDISTWHNVASELTGDDLDSYHISNDSLFISMYGPLTIYNHSEPIAIYHSQWPNRNIGGAPVPSEQYSGHLVETTRPLGDIQAVSVGEAEAIWGINGDYGQAWLFTWDGIFITKLLEDSRTHPLWRFEEGVIQRGSIIEGVSPGPEHFWPSLTVADDGNVYYVAGKEQTSILRVDGIDTIKRLDLGTFEVTSEHLEGASNTYVESHGAQVRDTLTVYLSSASIQADGDLTDWTIADWKRLDTQLEVEAALAVSSDSLYVAFRNTDEDLLNNSGLQGFQQNFVTGGGIDIWVGAGDGQPERASPVAGDVRIFITREQADPLGGPIRASLFEETNPALPTSRKVIFNSPIAQTTMARIDDVSQMVRLGHTSGTYEVAIPLDLIGVEPLEGSTILGDVGVFFGDGVETKRRLYWNNKSNTMVSDMPTEADFNPPFWGIWVFSATIVNDTVSEGDLPREYALEQGYPNPFNPQTTIQYRLPVATEVTVEVFNMLGQRVAVLLKNAPMSAGTHEVVWDASGMASGVYLYRMYTDGFTASKTIVFVK